MIDTILKSCGRQANNLFFSPLVNKSCTHCTGSSEIPLLELCPTNSFFFYYDVCRHFDSGVFEDPVRWYSGSRFTEDLVRRNSSSGVIEDASCWNLYHKGNAALATVRSTSSVEFLRIPCVIIPLWYVLWRGRSWSTRGPGGGSFTKIVRGCACRTSKIWLSLYQFFAKFPTHQYTIFERKAPNLDQIGCFLQ